MAADSVPDTTPAQAPRNLTVRQAAFIGVGAMVGAGIFAVVALDFVWKRAQTAVPALQAGH